MLIKHAPDIRESEVTPREVYVSRRNVLALGAGVAALAVSPSALAAAITGFAKTPFGAGEEQTPKRRPRHTITFWNWEPGRPIPPKTPDRFLQSIRGRWR